MEVVVDEVMWWEGQETEENRERLEQIQMEVEVGRAQVFTMVLK